MKVYVKCDEDIRNLEDIVRNPRTRSRTLQDISDMHNTMLDLYIAEHPNTSVETLDELANRYLDIGSEPIGTRLAYNKNTSSKTLNTLSRYGSWYVVGLVAVHQNTSPDTLSYIFEKADDIFVIESLAVNPNTPADILEHIADDDSLMPHFRESANKTLHDLGIR
jgi:hypothetical protein